MYLKTRALLACSTVATASVAVACGGTGNVPGFDGDAGWGQGGGTAFGNTGAGDDGGGFAGVADGATGAERCTTLGATRGCCGSANAKQTCTGSLEFPVWGPCLDANGNTVTCSVGCVPREDGTGCDAGTDAAPPKPPPPPELCTNQDLNTEPEILVGYSPAAGQSVGLQGQVKVWVNDEHPPFIAPGEQVDPSTGAITAPGDRTATAPDGLLWEPALYIAPQTPQNGGTPHFPSWIKGWYNANPPNTSGGVQVPGMDPVPRGASLSEKYTGEDIWDVSSLGLSPGTYMGVFVVHDGDDDRAIGCVTIAIGP